MSNNKEILQTMSLMFGLTAMPYDEMLIFGDEKLMGASVNLVIEIDELLDGGHTVPEIKELIDKANFKEKLEVTDDDAKILRNYAYRLLEIRYNLYMEEKNKEKARKRLFNE